MLLEAAIRELNVSRRQRALVAGAVSKIESYNNLKFVFMSADKQNIQTFFDELANKNFCHARN